MAEALAMEAAIAIEDAERQVGPPDPKPRDHDWRPTFTPPDSASHWYRCETCTVFGYRKRGRTIVPYRCQIKSCRQPAVDRVQGRRGPRGAYLWRCAGHLEDGDG